MWRWAVLLLAACNEVYGLDPTKPRDAGVLADRDGDGVGDAEDNCPDVANAPQADTDGDLRGDVCDECPLLRRASGDADRDGVGDACDPQPTLARECLTVLETFRDPAAFDAHWTTELSGGPSTVRVADGKLAFTPASGVSTVVLTETSTAGLQGSVVVLGDARGPDPIVVAFAGKDPTGVYGCRLQGADIAVDVHGPSNELLSSLVPDHAAGERFLVRLDVVDAPLTVSCRVDFGASVAAQAKTSQRGTGPAGVRLAAVPAELDAVAFIASRPTAGVPCTTEYR